MGCLTQRPSLRGILTRHRDDEGVTVCHHAGAANTHAVDALFQDRTGLCELILGGLLTLRYEGDARTALKVNTELRHSLLVTREKHQRIYNGQKQDEQSDRALRPGS